MRIAFIADGRAEHTRRWLKYFTSTGDTLLLLSTFPCSVDLPGLSVEVLPGVFRPGDAFVKTSDVASDLWSGSIARLLVNLGLDSAVRGLWHRLNVLDVLPQSVVARKFLRSFQPDVIHAMRLQNEGYVTAACKLRPWILSLWGSDFEYFTARYLVHRSLARRTLPVASALIADCRRDLATARRFGLRLGAPTRLVPGNGGVDFALYELGLPASERPRLVLYPRGLAPQLRIDTLLDAAELLAVTDHLDGMEVVLLAPPALVPAVQKMILSRSLPLTRVRAQSFASQREFSRLLQRTAVIVSPATSDGTPNSMLEAMACGAFPVMGNIESIREWITHGRNGLLFNPRDPKDLASCLLRALDDVELRAMAQTHNVEFVRQHADYGRVMPQVRRFYQAVAGMIDIPVDSHAVTPNTD